MGKIVHWKAPQTPTLKIEILILEIVIDII